MASNPNDPDQRTPQNLPSREPRPQPPYSWWWVVSALAAALVLGIGGMVVLRYIARPIALLILAISIASALGPIIDWLSQRMLPRPIGVFLVYAVLILMVGGVFAAIVPLLVAQIHSLVGQIPTWLPQITNWLGQYGFDAQGLRNTILNEAGQLGIIFFRLPFQIINILADFFLVLILSIYWIILSPANKRFFLSFFPAGRKNFMLGLITNTGREMGGYIRGSAINGLIIGVATYIGLSLIGVPYALTLAALSALMEFFPVIGPVISGTATTLVALSISTNLALITLIYAIALQQLEGHILVPIIMRSQARVSPLVAIFAIMAGTAVGGLLGALIAIPVATVISVLVRWVIAPAIRWANGVGAEEV